MRERNPRTTELADNSILDFKKRGGGLGGLLKD